MDGPRLEFACVECEEPVTFSAFGPIYGASCPVCERRYSFESESLQVHLRKFEALCRQLRDSEEILSQAAVAVDVNGHEVKIPFRLLLTRLNSILTLEIEGKRTEIRFRVDATRD
jgi:hypothetical protein